MVPRTIYPPISSPLMFLETPAVIPRYLAAAPKHSCFRKGKLNIKLLLVYFKYFSKYWKLTHTKISFETKCPLWHVLMFKGVWKLTNISLLHILKLGSFNIKRLGKALNWDYSISLLSSVSENQFVKTLGVNNSFWYYLIRVFTQDNIK